MWGASVHLAYAVQMALAVLLAASLAWLWRSDAAFELKASALATGSLLANGGIGRNHPVPFREID